MKTELYKVIKSIDTTLLSEEDKEDLLQLFIITKNPLIRDHIAMIFSDTQYNKAVPHIIRKIKDKNSYGNNGTLVAALGGLNASNYFIELVNIVCTQDYEARLWALDLIEDSCNVVPMILKEKALQILKSFKFSIDIDHKEDYKNSRLHFIDESILIISTSLNHPNRVPTAE